MTVRRACNDRSLGSNDADIDPHPATLPPTNTIGHTIGHNSLFPAHQFQTKDFRKTFRQIYLRPHHGKTNDQKQKPLLQEKRERSTDANLKTVRANFFTNFYTQTFSQITIGHIYLQNGEFVAQQNADVGFAQVPIVSDQTTARSSRSTGTPWLRSVATSSASAFDRRQSAGVDADSTRAPSCSADTCTLLPRASRG